MAPQQLLSRKEVAARSSKEQCVFIIDNVVYDVTKFLDEHPGGHEVLVEMTGQDASENFHDVGHSFDAKELMQKYVIAELVEEDRVELARKQQVWDDSKTDAETSFLSSWKFPLVLGLVVTVLYTYLFG